MPLFTNHPDAVYAFKANIMRPGNQTAATAAEANAQARVNERLSTQGVDAVSVTVGAGAIEPAGS